MKEVLYLDFETYYSKEYSLRKMTAVEYIHNPQFEVQGCAVAIGDSPAVWLEGPAFAQWIKSHDPNDYLAVSHNATFDMSILSWHYNWVPAMMACTLSMARATMGHYLRSFALAAVSQELGLPAKGDCIKKVIGKNLDVIKADATLYEEFQAYAIRDVDNCRAIFKHVRNHYNFPNSELKLLDLVIRCCVQPQLQLDPTVLCEHLVEVKKNKEEMLAQALLAGCSGPGDLMSNEKFADLLRLKGVTPPEKISPITGKTTYAFAKTDNEFLKLQDHPDIAVQTIVAARLSHKSTLEETRCEKMLRIAQLPIQTPYPTKFNFMPVPLRYSGAHTHRLSGDWGFNMQNLPRGSALRRALVAPPGHKIVTVDSAQVEARGVAALCNQPELVNQFRNGEDVYCNFASLVFGKPITKADKAERFIGKTAVLGLGYGLGAKTYRERIKSDSRNQVGKTIDLSEVEAKKVVDTYRGTYMAVPEAWHTLNSNIYMMANAKECSFQFGPVELKYNHITLPSGLRLTYDGLSRVEGEWYYRWGGYLKKLYGGKMLENITQACARIIVMDAAMRIKDRLGINIALQAHDELVYVVADEQVEEVSKVLTEEMNRPVPWCPTWPLASEVGVGDNYGDAK